jgi:methyl-accepting chemotaxis protein
MSSNAQSSAQGARQAAESARVGAQTVDATIAGMQTIKTKVGLSMQKVTEMGQRSEQIDTIIETIDNIAAQTNLLALNAAIEAARVQAKGEKTVEVLIQQHMLGAVNLLAELLASGRELASNDLVELACLAKVEDFCISDADGVITTTNKPGSMGFRFSEDPRLESSVFRPLLGQRDGVVIRPIVIRDQDKKPYIYVGVSHRDRPGIVQAGSPADLVYSLGGYARGFAVVASEVGQLAEHAKKATKEVANLIRDLQKTVNEVVLVMEDGTREVENGSSRAAEASEVLSVILKAAETVNQQVSEIASAIQHMSTSSTELVSAMETVSSIVGKNTSATERMAANSSALTQAVENIASVSEENSAAVEQVSASTEEVLAQVEQVASSAAALMQMAQGLQKIVAQFSLAS